LKIAIVYNRDSKNVVNLFGIPNRERIGKQTIKRIVDALKSHKHRVRAFEGDKDLIDRLEEFMPRVLKGERPGLVFNVSYGIQGQARYAHVPSILEMVGIPYVGSGPLAHGLALDKVMAKMIFQQHGLPTPDYTVVNSWEDCSKVHLPYPLIVKPRNEAVSFGIKIVHNKEELTEAADLIFQTYMQPVLVEHFIDGREINVGLLGNSPPETFSPVELVFGKDGPPIYTYQDKTHKSERQIDLKCPAPVSEKLTQKAQELSRRAFEALGCYDCARVDMRLDDDGHLFILEVNSLPSLGEFGSYTAGAEQMGLDFEALVNRLVDVASARYFGTPRPIGLTTKEADSGQLIASFLTQRRDEIERRLKTWTNLHSRTHDPVGIQEVMRRISEGFEEIGLKKVDGFTDHKTAWTWETQAGFVGGTLLIGHADVPLGSDVSVQEYRRTPEWLHGEGIGLSRAPLVMLEFALKALKSLRRLRLLPIGVLYYTDEGRDCSQSAEMIRAASEQARQVIVLRPCGLENKVVIQRRGWRRYRLHVEDRPARLGQLRKKPEVVRWLSGKLDALSKLSSKDERLAIAVGELHTSAFQMLLPHAVNVTLMLSYGQESVADKAESQIKEILGKEGFKWDLKLLSDRPPMVKRPANQRLAESLAEVASQWDIPFGRESSLWPSVCGLVPSTVAAVCGLGPVAQDLYTPREAVERISLLQRTLLLAEFLAKAVKDDENDSSRPKRQ
jgi:D-alanine-D-alanine ligase